jgi:hypothetical protein
MLTPEPCRKRLLLLSKWLAAASKWLAAAQAFSAVALKRGDQSLAHKAKMDCDKAHRAYRSTWRNTAAPSGERLSSDRLGRSGTLVFLHCPGGTGGGGQKSRLNAQKTGSSKGWGTRRPVRRTTTFQSIARIPFQFAHGAQNLRQA